MDARTPACTGSNGFTFVELIVVMVIGSMILGGAYSAILSQSRLFRAQTELAEARTTLRGATAVLSSSLMEAAATDSDISAISDSSFTIREYHMAGTVCSHVTVGADKYFGLQELKGGPDGSVTAADSVVVYDAYQNDWDVAGLSGAWTGADAWAGGNTPVCFWGDSTTAAPRPQAAVRLNAPASLLASIQVGAPLRVFRSTEYGVFQRNGDWWLGRRVSGATTWELLTGPLVAPASGGIDLTYYKSDGTTATLGSAVAAVEVFLWALGGDVSVSRTVQDSVRVRIHLRNNAD